MLTLRTAILALFLIAAPAHASKIIVHNDLAACTSLTVRNINQNTNLALATVDIQLQPSIAACGCKSALASYSTSVTLDRDHQDLQTGLIALKQSGILTLVLATEPALIAGEDVELHLECAPPL